MTAESKAGETVAAGQSTVKSPGLLNLMSLKGKVTVVTGMSGTFQLSLNL